ncbi:MAG: M24 family metallopeptidase [Kiritimatiellae bacterium]|nr:M24 family metallopeptidase [Kiritimatiellia bacterium]
MFDAINWKRDADLVAEVLSRAPSFDKEFRIGEDEFRARWKKTWGALEAKGIDIGFVYSDEHYCGDVPYFGGNTNIHVEPVAGVVGRNGFFLLAGLEGGYCAELLSPRSGCKVRKVEMLKLADEDYPVEAVPLDEVFEEACGRRPKNIGLLTPTEVIPTRFFLNFRKMFDGEENVIDVREILFKVKYEKSENEMRMISEAARICDVMIEGMLAVLRPGLYETQVAQWGYAVAKELGVETRGFDVMVCAGESNRAIVGRAMNRKIAAGDVVMLGVGPKRDGLTACERCSVVCADSPSKLTEEQKYWFDFVEGAYKVGLDAYVNVAENNRPSKFQEQALVDYFAARSDEVSRRYGKPIDMVRLKPYTGTHNAGYTECQEFYGAITLNSEEPLGNRIVTMLDVAVRGYSKDWNDVVIPGLDYILVEKTLGKFGRKVEVFNRLPINVQHLVGRGFRAL